MGGLAPRVRVRLYREQTWSRLEYLFSNPNSFANPIIMLRVRVRVR